MSRSPLRRVFSALPAAIAIAIAGTAVAAPPPLEASATDRAAIALTTQRFVDAWNLHDAHAFSLVFTPDADFTNVVGVHAVGRDKVEAFHAPIFAGLFKDSHQTAKVRSIRMLTPELATVDVDWGMTGVHPPPGAPPGDRNGLIDWIMARQPNGAWLVMVMHNAELPSPELAKVMAGGANDK